jgi:hypothetical protein
VVPVSLGPGLALLGVLVLLGLALQGWWRTRRARARVGGPGARVEPSLEAQPPFEAPSAFDPPALRSHPRPVPRLDALIDAIVPLTLDAPVSGEMLLQHLPASRRAGGKPFYVEGLDSESGQWEVPAPGHRYGELQAGVQLSSRSGPLGEIEYSEFVHKMQALAEAVGAHANPPDMLEVVNRARELDAQTGPLDMQLAVTLRSQGAAWSLGYLQQMAARLGFVPGAVPGRLVLPAAEDSLPPMLVLGFDAQAALADDPQAAAVRECTLELDVPQTPARAEPFPAWHRCATELAAELRAVVLDDQGREVTLHAYAGIGQALQDIYHHLDRLDLAAGSAAARRLFS